MGNSGEAPAMGTQPSKTRQARLNRQDKGQATLHCSRPAGQNDMAILDLVTTPLTNEQTSCCMPCIDSPVRLDDPWQRSHGLRGRRIRQLSQTTKAGPPAPAGVYTAPKADL